MAKKNSRRRRRRGNTTSTDTTTTNFCSSAGIGCWIARREDTENDWLLEWQDKVDTTDFTCPVEEFPDVALDPNDDSITFCNVSLEMTKIAYISIYDATVRGKRGQVLQAGTTTDNEGTTRNCVTFIILCPPCTFCHLCTVDLEEYQSITDVQIESDVQEWNRHPNPNDEHALRIGFPLQGGPFLCTQSEGGHLTHFFSGNLHALDFRCDLGSPLVAVANGVVASVCDDNTLTGISVSNLFTWNSILIKVTEEKCNDEPLLVEYVHIATSLVKVGDVVKRGDVIGTSGSVGFSPEPHLHFSAYRSSDPTAPTVRVKMISSDDSGEAFLPIAGQWYTADGRVEAPGKTTSE